MNIDTCELVLKYSFFISLASSTYISKCAILLPTNLDSCKPSSNTSSFASPIIALGITVTSPLTFSVSFFNNFLTSSTSDFGTSNLPYENLATLNPFLFKNDNVCPSNPSAISLSSLKFIVCLVIEISFAPSFFN